MIGKTISKVPDPARGRLNQGFITTAELMIERYHSPIFN